MSTDSEVIARATRLCNRGELVSAHENINTQRLKRIVASDDALEARFLIPALIEIIERRGLK